MRCNLLETIYESNPCSSKPTICTFAQLRSYTTQPWGLGLSLGATLARADPLSRFYFLAKKYTV